MNNPSMNPILRDFWMTQSRGKVLHGGRASSKSWDTAAQTVRIAQATKVRILCTRMYQNKIEESVYNLINSQIDRFGQRNKFNTLKNKITCSTTGSEFLFYGLARNIDEIKSLEGVDILWIEEAHSLTKEMWDILEPTIRKNGSEIWVVFNPKLASDFAYRRFVVDPPEDYLVRQINYPDNPFLSETMKKVIEAKKKEDEDDFNHVYLGRPLTDDDGVIIKRSWIQSCVDAHEKLGVSVDGQNRIGYDVADSGDDKNAMVGTRGNLTDHVEEWKGQEDELMQSCQRVWTYADLTKSEVHYDQIGVGAGCGSKFKEINIDRYTETRGSDKLYVKYKGFIAGGAVINQNANYEEGVKNKDFFSNVKAQAWWHVADRMRMTHNAVSKGESYDESEIISISSNVDHLERLIDELSTPKRTFDGKGKVKVESKDDLAKRDVKSPNLADAFIMAYWQGENKSSGIVLPNRRR